MVAVEDGLQAVRARIARAVAAVGRSADSVRLIAVSKTFPAASIAAALRSGQLEFGENYAQEGADKLGQVRALAPDATPTWHFIGPIQSNKTRIIAEHFDWAQSVDRLKVAQRLSEQRPTPLRALNICIQVNIGAEATKSGVAPAAVLDLANEVARLPHLRLRGLMAIPDPSSRTELIRQFEAMHALWRELRVAQPDVDTLSMGMSDDFEDAIAAGATMVRVGRLIFGERT